MSDNVYFEGDPETDSARRHLERVLSGREPARRKWPWMMAALGGGGLWLLWHSGRAAARSKTETTAGPGAGAGGPAPGNRGNRQGKV